MCVLENIEARFRKVTGYEGDLSQYPLEKSSGFATDKDKSRDFAEVFTPPYIVDKMLDAVPNYNGSKNLDLCAGHGQFTIRLLRKLSQVKGFDVGKYLKTKNFFAELQLESCYKLLWVFGTGINLAIGNALELKKLPKNWKGIWLYVEKVGIWVNITDTVKSEVQVSLNANLDLFPYDEGMEKSFVAKLKTIQIGRTFDEMKKALEGHEGQYEVILSNPPYQVMDEGFGASARPIYHKIVMYAIDQLKPQYVCMITPSRWMAGGKGLDSYRARMLNDKRISKIVDFPGENEVFDTVMIKGGVSFFLWERDRDPKETLCEFNDIPRNIGEFDVLIRNNVSNQIIRKVLATHKGSFCNGKVYSNKPFGMATNFTDWVPQGTPGSVKVYSVNRQIKWAMANTINDPHGILGKHKVCIAKARNTNAEGEGKPSLVTGYTFQISKSEACTETYIVVGAFNSKKESDNYEAYLQTKFYRFCLMQRLISQDINRKKFAWVPDLGSYVNPVTDADLFAHFNLTKKEIEHINSTIKEI